MRQFGCRLKYDPSLVVQKLNTMVHFSLYSPSNRNTSCRGCSPEAGDMFSWFAVPLAVVFAVATVYVPRSPPENPEKDKTEQSDGSSSKEKSDKDKPDKDKTEQTGERSSKRPPGRTAESSAATPAKGRRPPRVKQQD
jgi:hypothetical protein